MVSSNYSDLMRIIICLNTIILKVVSPLGTVANILDCNIVISESELKSNNYVHFWTNIVGKGMNPLLPTSFGLNNPTRLICH